MGLTTSLSTLSTCMQNFSRICMSLISKVEWQPEFTLTERSKAGRGDWHILTFSNVDVDTAMYADIPLQRNTPTYATRIPIKIVKVGIEMLNINFCWLDPLLMLPVVLPLQSFGDLVSQRFWGSRSLPFLDSLYLVANRPKVLPKFRHDCFVWFTSSKSAQGFIRYVGTNFD